MENKKYETIIFEVEKGLQKPKEGFWYNKCSIENICPRIFQRLKNIPGLKKTSNPFEIRRMMNKLKISGEINEPMEVLHYKYDTHQTEIYSQGKKSLFSGLIKAYKEHYPIVVSPDMIWILFLQGYSRFMEKYSELVRSEYVNFQGQKELIVNKLGKSVLDWNEEDWKDIISKFVHQIKENVGEKIISNLQSNYSTTNSITLAASQVSIMSGLKQYFKYVAVAGGCGISSIHLEGSEEDWMKIRSKLEFLSKKEMALGWWTKHLIPLIDKIIMTKRYYNQHKEINEEIREFWKNMVRVKFGENYDPDVLDGWIIKFIPNLTESTPKIYDKLKVTNIPDQIIECPITLINFNEIFTEKTIYKSSLASGFFGMDQDKETFTVRPVIGYAIVVDEKETSPVTEEDKKYIINEYFS